MSWRDRCSLCSRNATRGNYEMLKLRAVFVRRAHEGSNLSPTAQAIAQSAEEMKQNKRARKGHVDMLLVQGDPASAYSLILR